MNLVGDGVIDAFDLSVERGACANVGIRVCGHSDLQEMDVLHLLWVGSDSPLMDIL